ncbi:MAG: hypothetical protein ACOYLC_07940 [Armatimonadaceae bacterium]
MVPPIVPRIMAGISVALIILLMVARLTELDVVTRQFWILPVSVGLVVAARLMGGKGRRG